MNLLWPWLLKYSSFLMTGAMTFAVGYILHLISTKRSALIFYTSHLQLVQVPNQPQAQPKPQAAPIGQGQAIQQPPNVVGTFTLFLYNDGRATAKNVQVGHFLQPFAHSVYPDMRRNDERTPGGGWLMRLEFIPPKAMVTITYLTTGIFNVDQVLSYVGWEDGAAKRIPVMLQRIWPKWWLRTLVAIFYVGLWVILNLAVTLINFLWRVYYTR